MKRKVLITGASGLLGRRLLSCFKDASWETLGLAYSRARDNLLKVDLSNQDELMKVINNFQPSFIIHAAAQRFPDKVEKDYEKSVRLNVETSKNLAEISAKNGIHLLFISTDYVFDGTKAPYKEEDSRNPLNKYGQTKADAEAAILAANSNASVLRIPVLYGDEEYLGESAISVLLKALLNVKKFQSVSDYERRCPAHTDDVAHICHQLLEKRISDNSIKGIYQWSGEEVFTKYKMVRIMAEEFQLPMDHITPASKSDDDDATRPYNVQMSTEHLTKLGIGSHTPFRKGIKSFSKFLP